MVLENNYYLVYSAHYGADTARFHVALLPGCDVYRGHFPGKPVAPGVCNIGMVKECLKSALRMRVSLSFIRKCRFLAVLSPEDRPELDIDLQFYPAGEGELRVVSVISDPDTVYMECDAVYKLHRYSE